MDKEERIELLVESGIITQDVAKLVRKFNQLLEENYIVNWTNETSLMFVTHLGVSINRMILEDPLEDIPDEVRKEISIEDPLYIWAINTLTNIGHESGILLKVTESEALLIATYLKIMTN